MSLNTMDFFDAVCKSVYLVKEPVEKIDHGCGKCRDGKACDVQPERDPLNYFAKKKLHWVFFWHYFKFLKISTHLENGLYGNRKVATEDEYIEFCTYY